MLDIVFGKISGRTNYKNNNKSERGSSPLINTKEGRCRQMSMKHIVQLRRGVKDDASGRNDWVEYEKQEYHMIPFPGELVLEYDNGIPRLKIGDGVHEFSALPYMSVDSFILPTQATIILNPDNWKEILDENGIPIPNRYYQMVQIAKAAITPTSKIDLQPSPEQLLIFHQKDIAFTVINENGNIRVCVVGQKPNNEYSIQATVTEVVADNTIIGSTITTPYDIQSLIDR